MCLRAPCRPLMLVLIIGFSLAPHPLYAAMSVTEILLPSRSERAAAMRASVLLSHLRAHTHADAATSAAGSILAAAGVRAEPSETRPAGADVADGDVRLPGLQGGTDPSSTNFSESFFEDVMALTFSGGRSHRELLAASTRALHGCAVLCACFWAPLPSALTFISRGSPVVTTSAQQLCQAHLWRIVGRPLNLVLLVQMPPCSRRPCQSTTTCWRGWAPRQHVPACMGAASRALTETALAPPSTMPAAHSTTFLS